MIRHTAPIGSAETIDEATADLHDTALAVVQRLLRERGVRARCHHRIGLGLYANRMDGVVWPDRSPLRSWMERHPPELVVIGSRGLRVVTVTVGARSGCYLVALHDGSDLQAVRREWPERVVELVLAARYTS